MILALLLALVAMVAIALLDDTVSPWQARLIFKWLTVVLAIALIGTATKTLLYRQELRTLIQTCR